MAGALQAKGIPHAYIPFEGEQHGFRRASSIRRSIEAEVYFYGSIFGFELADPVDPIEIHNLCVARAAYSTVRPLGDTGPELAQS